MLSSFFRISIVKCSEGLPIPVPYNGGSAAETVTASHNMCASWDPQRPRSCPIRHSNHFNQSSSGGIMALNQ